MSVPRESPRAYGDGPLDMIRERPNPQIKGSHPTNEGKLTLYWILSLQSLDGHWNDVSPAWRYIGKQYWHLRMLRILRLLSKPRTTPITRVLLLRFCDIISLNDKKCGNLSNKRPCLGYIKTGQGDEMGRDHFGDYDSSLNTS